MRWARFRQVTLASALVYLFVQTAVVAGGAGAGDPCSRVSTAGLSVRIVQNFGQFPPGIRFAGEAGGWPIWLTEDSLWLGVIERSPEAVTAGHGEEGVAIRFRFPGDPADWRWAPTAPTGGRVSYYRGRDPAGWHERVPVWGGVRIRGIAPGVDLLVGGVDGLIRTVRDDRAGTADPGEDGPILPVEMTGARVRAAGADHLWLGTQPGGVCLPLGESERAWRVRDASREWAIPARGSIETPGRVAGPRGGAPAPADPILRVGTYLGGTLWDQAEAVATDPSGSIYLAGHTLSLDFPAAPGLFALSHNIEAFFARLDPTGATLEALVLLIGYEEEFFSDMVLDGSGSAYLVGRTDSQDFPATPGAYDITPNGGFDAFAARVAPDGTLDYVTLLGGVDAEDGAGIAVDEQGRAYVTGGTWSTGFPVTADAHDSEHNGQRDLFLARFSPAGDALEYATFFGGSGQDQPTALVRDADGGLYLTGWTRSEDFPATAGAYADAFAGEFDAFLLKFSPLPGSIEFATLLGGSGEDRGTDLAIGPADGVILTGRTSSTDFPTTSGSFDAAYGGGSCDLVPCPDGFVVGVSNAGSTLSFASYLGGGGWDEAHGLALAPDGTIWLTGETGSPDFPLGADPWDPIVAGGRDGFIARLSASAGSLADATFIGGDALDSSRDVALGTSGGVYLAGFTLSDGFPTTQGAFGSARAGDYDAFALVLDLPDPAPGTLLYWPAIFYNVAAGGN